MDDLMFKYRRTLLILVGNFIPSRYAGNFVRSSNFRKKSIQNSITSENLQLNLPAIFLRVCATYFTRQCNRVLSWNLKKKIFWISNKNPSRNWAYKKKTKRFSTIKMTYIQQNIFRNSAWSIFRNALRVIPGSIQNHFGLLRESFWQIIIQEGFWKHSGSILEGFFNHPGRILLASQEDSASMPKGFQLTSKENSIVIPEINPGRLHLHPEMILRGFY